MLGPPRASRPHHVLSGIGDGSSAGIGGDSGNAKPEDGDGFSAKPIGGGLGTEESGLDGGSAI